MWSEEDSCIPLLSADMDYLSSPSHTLTQVLDRAASCLVEGEGSGDEGDTGTDDDDEDYDDYYGGEDLTTPR